MSPSGAGMRALLRLPGGWRRRGRVGAARGVASPTRRDQIGSGFGGGVPAPCLLRRVPGETAGSAPQLLRNDHTGTVRRRPQDYTGPVRGRPDAPSQRGRLRRPCPPPHAQTRASAGRPARGEAWSPLFDDVELDPVHEAPVVDGPGVGRSFAEGLEVGFAGAL
jgi:hypothetical protein